MFVLPTLRSPKEAGVTALRETLITELAVADTLPIGTRMYNFGIPSARNT